MDNIYYGIRKPMEGKKKRGSKTPINREIYNPASDFDRRPEPGKATYIGPSKLEGRDTMTKQGRKQKKKHVSKGRGQ